MKLNFEGGFTRKEDAADLTRLLLSGSVSLEQTDIDSFNKLRDRKEKQAKDYENFEKEHFDKKEKKRPYIKSGKYATVKQRPKRKGNPDYKAVFNKATQKRVWVRR